VDTAKGSGVRPLQHRGGDGLPQPRPGARRLLADARAVVDATQFLSGSGTDSPKGVLTGLSSASWRIQTNTVAVTAIGDIYALKQAVPARFFPNTTFAAHPTVWDTVYRFTGGNSAEPLLLPTRDGNVAGRPKFEWSTMSTGLTTTGQKIMLAGDFKTGFVIADRIGAQIEPVQHVFGATNRYPIGARGLYFYWRTGSTVVSTTANAPLRWLEVK
jgi:HK97 family phage major capsid protein